MSFLLYRNVPLQIARDAPGCGPHFCCVFTALDSRLCCGELRSFLYTYRFDRWCVTDAFRRHCAVLDLNLPQMHKMCNISIIPIHGYYFVQQLSADILTSSAHGSFKAVICQGCGKVPDLFQWPCNVKGDCFSADLVHQAEGASRHTECCHSTETQFLEHRGIHVLSDFRRALLHLCDEISLSVLSSLSPWHAL